MFTIEHHLTKDAKIQARKGFLCAGTRLVKAHTVKRKFTYRELTLLIGIVVAVVIAVTVMMGQFQLPASQGDTKTVELIPQLLTSLKSDLIIEMLTSIIF